MHNALSMSLPPTGTTACPHTAISPTLLPVMKLSAPVTVVVAADDPITSAFERRHRDWELLVEQVELHEIPDGGHYFVRTKPTQAAQAVLSAAKLVAYS